MESYDFSRYYFLDFLMVLTAVIALIASIRYRRKIGQSFLFSTYLLAFLILNGLCWYDEQFLKSGAVTNISNNCFVLLETAVFSIFLLQQIRSKLLKWILTAAVCLVLGFILGRWAILPELIDAAIPTPFILESVFLVFPCLFYYLELLSLPNPVALNATPPFWIVTGILLYSSCCIPVFLFGSHLSEDLKSQFNIIFSRNYPLYAILFTIFIRAYLCKSQPAA